MESIRNGWTAREAIAHGVTRSTLESSQYRREFFGAYSRADASMSYSDRVRLAMTAVPGAQFASHYTAARLLKAATPTTSDVHLGTMRKHASRRTEIVLHRYRQQPNLVRYQGIWITSPVQTFRDLASKLEFIDLLVLGDSLIHRERATVDDLATLVAAPRFVGSPLVRQVLPLIRTGAESPQETRLRLLLVSAGLPEPQVNFVVRDLTAGVSRRVDLAYPEWLIAIEFDGRHHIDREDQWQRDIFRREELEALGWRFVTVTSADLWKSPQQVLDRVTRALRTAGGPKIATTEGWRRHFHAA